MGFGFEIQNFGSCEFEVQSWVSNPNAKPKPIFFRCECMLIAQTFSKFLATRSQGQILESRLYDSWILLGRFDLYIIVNLVKISVFIQVDKIRVNQEKDLTYKIFLIEVRLKELIDILSYKALTQESLNNQTISFVELFNF